MRWNNDSNYNNARLKLTTPAYKKIEHTKDNFLFVHFKKRQSHSAMANVSRQALDSLVKKKKNKQTDRQLPMAAGSKNYRAPDVDMRTDASDIKRSYEFPPAHPSAQRLCPFHLRDRCRLLGRICVFRLNPSLRLAADLHQHVTQFRRHSPWSGSNGTANTAAHRKISSFLRLPRAFPHDNAVSLGGRHWKMRWPTAFNFPTLYTVQLAK